MTVFYRPDTIKKTLKILGNPDQNCVPLYYPPRAKHISQWEGDALIDLSALDLNIINVRKSEILIGSMVSLETLAKSDEIKSRWDGVLSEAARISTTMAMRNLSSIGGVLMNPLFPAEVVLVLLALDAQVVLLQNNGKETRIPVEEFLLDGHPILQKGCLIKEVSIPLNSRTHCVFNRVACTKSNASIVSVVVRGDLTRTKAHHLRIAVFGANSFPKRYHQAELALVNDLITMEGIQQCCTKISEETAPVSDFRAGAEYRTAMAEVLIRRSLIALRKIAVG
jgi:carbon-monoxide dehydrogenase medium subunit